MRHHLPLVALWASLAYLVAALAITSKLCFDGLRAFARGAAEAAGPFQAISPAWVIVTSDAALGRLWWLCSAVGLGVLLVALSAPWISLEGRNPAP
jgi:hypothetical protein